MSIVIPEEYKGETTARQFARGIFLRGADAERDRCIEIVRQCEERGDWTADLIIARLQGGLS